MAAGPVTTLHFTLPLCSLSNCLLKQKAKKKSQHLTPKTCECFPVSYCLIKQLKKEKKRSPEIISFELPASELHRRRSEATKPSVKQKLVHVDSR